MLNLEEDLAAVFFGDDFTATFLRQRPLAPDVEVAVILGVVDDEALEGRAIAAVRTARMPATADVRADDVLVALAAIEGMGIDMYTRLRVLDNPQRVNDGMELEALLSSV